MIFSNLPIFAGETLSQPLSGLSGSCVYLVQSQSNALFIRKVASDEKTSFRLERQFNKLSAFKGYDLGEVSTPKVLKTGYHQDCFYMDLEYICGLDLIEYLSTTDTSQIRNLGNHLGRFLIEMGKYPPIEEAPVNATQVFYEKTFSLVDNCPWLPDKIKADLFLSIRNTARLMEKKTSLCHGDLTFENILIDKNERIWLIDHLDSFFPYYWQDIAKLHQDLSGEWFRFRRSSTAVPKYSLAYLSDCVLKQVCRLDPHYSFAHNGLLALVFARILPYAKSGEVRDFALSRVSHYLMLSSREHLSAC